MDAAQKPRFWSRWVNFTPALVGHFYIGGDTLAAELAGMISDYWTQHGNSVEWQKWKQVQEQHLENIS